MGRQRKPARTKLRCRFEHGPDRVYATPRRLTAPGGQTHQLARPASSHLLSPISIMSQTTWFEWHKEDAINILMAVYHTQNANLYDDIRNQCGIGHQKMRRLVTELKEHGYLETNRGRNTDATVTEHGKTWLLRNRPRQFLRHKGSLMLAGVESWD